MHAYDIQLVLNSDNYSVFTTISVFCHVCAVRTVPIIGVHVLDRLHTFYKEDIVRADQQMSPLTLKRNNELIIPHVDDKQSINDNN